MRQIAAALTLHSSGDYDGSEGGMLNFPDALLIHFFFRFCVRCECAVGWGKWI